ncbi:MAG: ribosomal RNA small subunit methyltransferase A [Parcubacteria group bacterium]|nr:ribosomal RNA small subunit methyltransferase A [Parcubacteria group bacterium]
MPNPQTLAEKLGVRPSPDSGQHFLVDEKVLERIIIAAAPKKNENILEIGPGFGVLTRALAGRGANVVAVEFDRKLAHYLSNEFGASKPVRVIQGDILSFSNQEIAAWFNKEPYRVVSNIPYHITGRIIKKFVSSELPKPAGLVLLVQKEVAERVCAAPGDLSLLGLSVQLYAKPSIAFNVPREAFWPEPRVDSALLVIDDVSAIPNHPLIPSLIKEGKVIDEKRFWQISHIGFASPRKQLRNNLAAGLSLPQDAIKKALKQSKLPETARAQELSIPDWIRLVGALGKT